MDSLDSVFNDDTNFFHDTVLESTGNSMCDKELRRVFEELPGHIQMVAFEWGLSDTDFNSMVFNYLKRKGK